MARDPEVGRADLDPEAEVPQRLDELAVGAAPTGRRARGGQEHVDRFEVSHRAPKDKEMLSLSLMPEVTVIVPTKNRPGYLRTALESLANQDVSNDAYELLVVDDAPSTVSRDVTAERW